MAPWVPIGVRGRPVRITAPLRVPLGILGLRPSEPGVDLADTEPQLTADPKAPRTAALAAQVVEGLHADPQLRRQLRQRDDGIQAEARWHLRTRQMLRFGCPYEAGVPCPPSPR